VGLAAQLHGAGRTKERPYDRGLATPVISSPAAANVYAVHANIGRTGRQIVVSVDIADWQPAPNLSYAILFATALWRP